MDPASVIASVISSAISINKWVEDTKKKEAAISNLSTTVNLVYLILSPLEVGENSHSLTPSVFASLVSLADVLNRIKDHLDLWADKSIRFSKVMGFLAPSNVLQDLRDDSELLQQHLVAVSLALHVSAFLQGKSKAIIPVKEPSPVTLMKSSEAREFWHVMMGDSVFAVSNSRFFLAIKTYLQGDLNTAAQNALVLRLDEFDVGMITYRSVDQLVGQKTLKDAVNELQRSHSTAQTRKKSSTPLQPWLVWVDDQPKYNKELVSLAEQHGISVFHFYSTASAKAWICAHEGDLRARENVHRLRFITDNARWEQGLESGFMNLAAGELLIRFIRGRSYKAPVLVFCFHSLPSTTYVRRYGQSGSTALEAVCSDYIKALAKAETQDAGWRTFGAV